MNEQEFRENVVDRLARLETKVNVATAIGTAALAAGIVLLLTFVHI